MIMGNMCIEWRVGELIGAAAMRSVCVSQYMIL